MITQDDKLLGAFVNLVKIRSEDLADSIELCFKELVSNSPLLVWLSCRLWESTKTPLSLWSFSPSGEALNSAARALESALFCLHDLQLRRQRKRFSGKLRVAGLLYKTPMLLFILCVEELENTQRVNLPLITHIDKQAQHDSSQNRHISQNVVASTFVL